MRANSGKEMGSNSDLHFLHHCYFHKVRAIVSRVYAFFGMIAIIAILYYRIRYYNPLLGNGMAWLLMSCAELQLCFMWVLRQSFYWRPVSRTVFPEKLPKDEELPRIDVLICTADPNREPTFDVMNTVLSAMCLDYPANKLSVYVSDDGGSSITLNGIKEAWLFSTWWLPFCKRYNIYPICPKAYFQDNPQQHTMSKEFLQQRTIVKVISYNSFPCT